VTNASHTITHDELAALRAHDLDDQAILEVIEVAAAFNNTNRLLNTLAVRPDTKFFEANR